MFVQQYVNNFFMGKLSLLRKYLSERDCQQQSWCEAEAQ